MLKTIKALFKRRQSNGMIRIAKFIPNEPKYNQNLMERSEKALQELKETGKYGPDNFSHSE